jgi:hypothetical protein
MSIKYSECCDTSYIIRHLNIRIIDEDDKIAFVEGVDEDMEEEGEVTYFDPLVLFKHPYRKCVPIETFGLLGYKKLWVREQEFKHAENVIAKVVADEDFLEEEWFPD